MSLTARSLVAELPLDLRLLSAPSPPDPPLTWVHVSELIDPTPFLSGGELLLTTGLAQSDPGVVPDWEVYVDRLSQAGVLGLGFGTGLSYDTVPTGLIEAATRHDVALIEVPRQTPFIALSRAVSDAIARDEYAEISRTFDSQLALTRGALKADGTNEVVRLLAGHVAGWVLLVDDVGELIGAHPRSADRYVKDLAPEFARLRNHSGPVSSSVTMGSDTVDLQPIGTSGRRAGYLAVGHARPATRAHRHLIHAAVLLLTMIRQPPNETSAVEITLRRSLVHLLLCGERARTAELAQSAGLRLPTEPVRVMVASRLVRPAAGQLTDGWWTWHDGALTMIVSASDQGCADQLATTLGQRVGMSAPTTYADLDTAVRQAQQAAGSNQTSSAEVIAWEDLGARGVIGLLDPTQAHGFAEATLARLIDHDQQRGSRLIDALRSWLAHHGQWDPAASALGVHRHTLRNRIRTVESLLERDLGDPGVRSELWLALELIEPR